MIRATPAAPALSRLVTGRLHAIAMVDDPTGGLRLLRHGNGALAAIPRTGLDAAVVAAWTRRFDLALVDDAGPVMPAAEPILSLPTVVLAADPRVAGHAREYGRAVGAPVVTTGDPESVADALVAEQQVTSVTLVLLHDVLDESLIEAVYAGNARRVRDGRAPLTAGFMTAFDAPKLAWLMAKTLAVLTLRVPADAAVGRFDGVTGTATLRPIGSVRAPVGTSEPWTDPRTLAQSVVAHGVAFDLSLGDVVLCGHTDPPLPPQRTVVAPSCFHDGVCFRTARPGGPSVRRRASQATPLIWGIDSCGAIPLRDNAFGGGSSYALALLAGSAVAVIGPYLTLTSSGLAARAFEALLGNGWSTGEIATALGDVDDNTVDFDPYALLGSPDLRLAPPPGRPSEPVREAIFPVRVRRQDTVAVELPPAVVGLRDVVSDDGDDAWAGAVARRVQAPERAALVIAFDRPRHFTGRLRLGDTGPARAGLATRCDEWDRRLGVLAGYRFAEADVALAASVRAMVLDTAQALRAPYAVRATAAGALRWARTTGALRELEESVARHFIDAVVERDVSFDQESENGFVPGPLRPTTGRCHVCGARLYRAVDVWLSDRQYVRHKETCPNCFGVVLRLPSSPLASVGVAARTVDGAFRLRITPRSRVDQPVRVHIAVAPRRGPATHARGPSAVTIPAAGESPVDFEFPAAAAGVVTYRILVVCDGAVELYTAIDPGCPDGGRSGSPQPHSSPATSPRSATVVGTGPGPGQERPAALNQTG